MTEQLDLNRLRRHNPTTLVCLPDDTDPDATEPGLHSSEVVVVAGVTADILHRLHVRTEDDPEAASLLPPPLGDPSALAAIERIQVALGGAYRATPAQPVLPGGRYQLVPLRWARLDRADVATLGRIGRALGGALLPSGEELVVDVLQGLAGQRTPQNLVVDVARLHGLLELEWDDDVTDLAERLAAGPTARTVVLDRAGLDAYRRVTDRIITIWHNGDALARWLYQGD